jgi:hypothetical protein
MRRRSQTITGKGGNVNRATWNVAQRGARFRGMVYVDGYEIAKAWFDSLTQAEQWCVARAQEAMLEVMAR